MNRLKNALICWLIKSTYLEAPTIYKMMQQMTKAEALNFVNALWD